MVQRRRWPLAVTAFGMTLVELLIAMAVSGLIAVAAVSVLGVGRKGFAAVDAGSQLQENGRFAMEILQRLTLQAGYLEISNAASLHPGDLLVDMQPGVSGFNNATPLASDPANKSVARVSASSLGYGSDVLVLRYQAPASLDDSGTADASMIDCAGNAATSTVDKNEQIVSVLHVATGPDGEPALMCTVATGKSAGSPQPLVKGVESFQVLYGVDHVVSNMAPAMPAAKSNFVNRYLRADEMVVSGDAAGTAANWRRVRSLRIGMVLRSSASASRMGDPKTFYPLGGAPAAEHGAEGSAFSSDNDPGTVLLREPDGRLRRAVTFTVDLRNEQDA